MMQKQKITPFLWFDKQAEEAAKFYVSVFKNSKMGAITHYTGEEPTGKKGDVLTVSFELEGQEFVALNGGPDFKFTEAVSFVVNCESQEEVDYFWEKLIAGGGKEIECGWLRDKYGLSWQVVPTVFFTMIQDKDEERVRRVMKAMMQMKKFDIARIQDAFYFKK
jgi:predicted 3-demethylubiquinone-9 3-methyltransferase (glyoxalase superfamily)